MPILWLENLFCSKYLIKEEHKHCVKNVQNVKNFFSKYEQIRKNFPKCSHLLRKFSKENLILGKLKNHLSPTKIKACLQILENDINLSKFARMFILIVSIHFFHS